MSAVVAKTSFHFNVANKCSELTDRLNAAFHLISGASFVFTARVRDLLMVELLKSHSTDLTHGVQFIC